ncbi:helix-turn-helix domain-containing protein [Pediococcus inopinatus]|uniref:Helix-turn-helix domain-containing protein n=1 Tax=Pediococcus inopinatus TaxID=114090 RepID=A0ABZ0Q2D0_9LACO|nr:MULTISPECIES: helix-turn-helix transcriptional regulator [Pediococcus]AVL00203.1 transcriptional regulator [Pediococcus inopinatus]KRN61782.1 hypothetical protein IV83_GL000487 [Pediococcus inopinatus]PIO80379.1 transcriptional regulator [Pediococcus damnosus]WPC19322.1 helix-turn-helix domain-containing protein [Pediococcus inopinatus]WPC21113.1 helix-turn-helix domain-containing protein [Pediococcus inopinatus]
MKESLVKNIRKAAALKNLTLEQVGEKSGVGKKSIYRWDRVQPKISSVEKVGEFLNMDYRLLLPKEVKSFAK